VGHAQAQTALDDVMKAKKINIAIPTDFPPYGFVGTDLKPQGLDVDMANYIAAKLGVKVELVPVTSANRIPYLQTKKADLVISTLGKNPEREKVIDFTAAYSPFFQAVFAAKAWQHQERGRPGRQERGRHPRRHRRHGADQDRPGQRRHQTLRRQQRHRVGLRVGPGAADCHRRIGGRQHDGAQPAAGRRIQVRAQGLSPNFIGVGKGEDKLRLKVNEIIAAPKKRRHRQDGQKWLGRPAGDLPSEPLSHEGRARHDRTRLRWPCWRSGPCWLKGAALDAGPECGLAVLGVGAGRGLRLGAQPGRHLAAHGWPAYVELIRNTPFIVQLFFIFFGLPSGREAVARGGVHHRHGDQPGRVCGRDRARGHRRHAARPDRGGAEPGPHRAQTFVRVVLPPALKKVWPRWSARSSS
jgi:polar amino acid transport system substrate-binding protein